MKPSSRDAARLHEMVLFVIGFASTPRLLIAIPKTVPTGVFESPIGLFICSVMSGALGFQGSRLNPLLRGALLAFCGWTFLRVIPLALLEV